MACTMNCLTRVHKTMKSDYYLVYILPSVRLSVCLSVCMSLRMEELGFHCTNSDEI
jgi:hypothetical protein